MYSAALLFALVVSNAFGQPNDEVLVRVRVTDVAYTDYYPESDCPSESECIPFYFWFRYEASVREVVRGNFAGRRVNFARLQHAYFARKPRDWYLLLIRCGESVRSKVGVEYCVKDEAFANDPVGVARLVGSRHGA
jgi:hypothetical protein